jgi:hypothetical protein
VPINKRQKHDYLDVVTLPPFRSSPGLQHPAVIMLSESRASLQHLWSVGLNLSGSNQLDFSLRALKLFAKEETNYEA